MQWISAAVLVAAVVTIILICAGTTTAAAAAEATSARGRWGDACPRSCSCLLSEIRDLPMHRWFLEGATNNDSHPADSYQQSNEALYERDVGASSKQQQHDSLGLLRTSICVYQRDAEPEQWLGALPHDVQVLTILQAPGSGQLILRAEHFSAFTFLVALEVQGCHGDGANQASGHHSNDATSHGDADSQGEVVVMSDTLRPLAALQYLNLQYVRFLGQPDEAPLPTHTASYQYLAEGSPNTQDPQWKHKRPTDPHELVFLPPTEPLPYNEYKKAQEQAGLSVFAGLANLLFLRVYNCGLKEVRWEMFEGLSKLQYLSLENNLLLFIPDFAFYGTPNLKTLSLSRNKILSMQFTSLAGLLELEKLDLSHNNISHLSELSLPPFPKLITADFRHNPIEQAFAGTFDIMNATETLSLGGDGTSLQLKHSSLQGLRSLRRLTVSNAKVSALEQEMLLGVPRLKELELQGKIEALSFDAFISVPKLEVLTLHHCEIESISMDSFYGLYGLLALDLSFNLLHSLPPGVFDQQHSLRELQLQNNRLTELPDNIFSILPAKMIRLDSNPWHCSCAMRDWRPMSINKVKVKSTRITSVGGLDKGVEAKQVRETQYMFEKRVAPRCKTPVKYINWNVFHVLRKELRCGKAVSKKSSLWRKHEELRNITKQASLLQQKQSPSSVDKNLTTESFVSDSTRIQTAESSSTVTPIQLDSAVSSVETPKQPKPSSSDTEYSNNLKIQYVMETQEKPVYEDSDLNELRVIPGNSNQEQEIIAEPADSKKAQHKADLPKEQQEKLALKESPKPIDDEHMINNNGQQIKVSKKAWKLEMERLRSEKLKKFKQ